MTDPVATMHFASYGVRKSNIHVHHVDYDRIGNERFSDLMVICADCHSMLHKFIDKMASKGFSRRRVMQKLKPYCVRRVIMVHNLFGQNSFYRMRPVSFFREIHHKAP